eukprot:gene25716-30887_t
MKSPDILRPVQIRRHSPTIFQPPEPETSSVDTGRRATMKPTGTVTSHPIGSASISVMARRICT